VIPFNTVDSQFKAVGNFDDERVSLPGRYCDRGPAGRCAFPGCVSGDGLFANGSRLPVLTPNGTSQTNLQFVHGTPKRTGPAPLHLRNTACADGRRPHAFATSASLFAPNASAFFADALADLRPCIPRSSGSRHSSPFRYRKTRYFFTEKRATIAQRACGAMMIYAAMMYAAFATDK
jgi:hypothetical protein